MASKTFETNTSIPTNLHNLTPINQNYSLQSDNINSLFDFCYKRTIALYLKDSQQSENLFSNVSYSDLKLCFGDTLVNQAIVGGSHGYFAVIELKSYELCQVVMSSSNSQRQILKGFNLSLSFINEYKSERNKILSEKINLQKSSLVLNEEEPKQTETNKIENEIESESRLVEKSGDQNSDTVKANEELNDDLLLLSSLPLEDVDLDISEDKESNKGKNVSAKKRKSDGKDKTTSRKRSQPQTQTPTKSKTKNLSNSIKKSKTAQKQTSNQTKQSKKKTNSKTKEKEKIIENKNSASNQNGAGDKALTCRKNGAETNVAEEMKMPALEIEMDSFTPSLSQPGKDNTLASSKPNNYLKKIPKVISVIEIDDDDNVLKPEIQKSTSSTFRPNLNSNRPKFKPKPKPKKEITFTRLYVSNLPSNTDQDELYACFSQFGPIDNVYIPKIGNFFCEYGFVEFKTNKSATLALAQSHRLKLRNSLLSISIAHSKPRSQAPIRFNESVPSRLNRELTFSSHSKSALNRCLPIRSNLEQVQQKQQQHNMQFRNSHTPVRQFQPFINNPFPSQSRNSNNQSLRNSSYHRSSFQSSVDRNSKANISSSYMASSQTNKSYEYH